MYNPRIPKHSRFLLKNIFFDQKSLYHLYLKFFDAAVEMESGIPHERAMIKFREYYIETATGWILRLGMTPPVVKE